MNNDIRKDPNQSNKMRTYRKVKKKDNYSCEEYLHQVTNIRHRTTMTKLRLSNHKLAIETGRYTRPYKKPNERICPLCKKEAEDEKHFLISCPEYQEKQKSLFDCVSAEFKIPIGKMSTENIFLLLLNPPSNNIELQKIITKHLHECYEIRKNVGNSKLRLENYRICKFICTTYKTPNKICMYVCMYVCMYKFNNNFSIAKSIP